MITQLATPVAPVVPVQVCAVDPPPNVKVTVLPATPAPAGSSVDSTPDNVTDCPFTADVAPVYNRAVSS